MVRSGRLGLVAITLVLGTGACSSATPAADTPEVASLAEASGTPTAQASATLRQSRPRARLDDTDEDFNRLAKPFNDCLEAHGQKGQKLGWAGGDDLPPDRKAAQKACEMLWPLPPWEHDPANPKAKDFTRDVVKCLKNKGVRYVEPGEDGIGISAGGAQNDARSISRTGEFLDDCEREVAARK